MRKLFCDGCGIEIEQHMARWFLERIDNVHTTERVWCYFCVQKAICAVKKIEEEES